MALGNAHATPPYSELGWGSRMAQFGQTDLNRSGHRLGRPLLARKAESEGQGQHIRPPRHLHWLSGLQKCQPRHVLADMCNATRRRRVRLLTCAMPAAPAIPSACTPCYPGPCYPEAPPAGSSSPTRSPTAPGPPSFQGAQGIVGTCYCFE